MEKMSSLLKSKNLLNNSQKILTWSNDYHPCTISGADNCCEKCCPIIRCRNVIKMRYQFRFHAFSCGECFISSFSFCFILLCYFPTYLCSDSLSSDSSYNISVACFNIKLKIWNWFKTFGYSVLKCLTRRWKKKKKITDKK